MGTGITSIIETATTAVNNDNQQLLNEITDAIDEQNDYERKLANNISENINNLFYETAKPAYLEALNDTIDIIYKKLNYDNIYNEVDIYKSLKQRKDRELKIIENRIANYKQHNNRDNRHTIDERNKNKTYDTILTIILIFYYIAFIGVLFTCGFIGKELYKDKKIILLCIFYLTLPLYLDYIINLANNFIIWIQEQLMILKPELSYNDIIKYEDLINHIDYSDKNESLDN